MSTNPFLTICLPSRNRQFYCTETAVAIAKNLPDNVELLIADNSDDPELLPSQLGELLKNPQVTFLTSEDHTLSMVDNWERCIEKSSGQWVSIIGDDDFIDPELNSLLAFIENANPECDSVSWNRITYNWPDNRDVPANISIALKSDLHIIDKKVMVRNLFCWEGSSRVPNCPFGIYHGAIKRSLLESIKQAFSGRYFEHPIVDYENLCKVVALSQGMVFCERPMSIMGAGKASNSAALNSPERTKKNYDIFIKESNDFKIDQENFPISSLAGVTATVGQTMHWFKQKYDLEFDGWEENFVKACAQDCEDAKTEADFIAKRGTYNKAIRKWKAGKYSKHFNPKFKSRDNAIIYIGYHNNQLYVKETIGDAQTPAELYEIINAFLVPTKLIGTNLNF